MIKFLILCTLLRPLYSRRCSTKSCEELDIDPEDTGHSNGVCGESNNAPLGGQCSGSVTFEEAFDFCIRGEMRLCTAQELQDDETANTGCGYDNVLLWSETECEDGGYMAVAGEFGQGPSGECFQPEMMAPTRCCADKDIHAPDCGTDPGCTGPELLCFIGVAECCENGDWACPNGATGESNCPVQICEQLQDVGPCDAAIPRYWYNYLTQYCELFTYGGCEGNENNFETVEECEHTCAEDCEFGREIVDTSFRWMACGISPNTGTFRTREEAESVCCACKECEGITFWEDQATWSIGREMIAQRGMFVWKRVPICLFGPDVPNRGYSAPACGISPTTETFRTRGEAERECCLCVECEGIVFWPVQYTYSIGRDLVEALGMIAFERELMDYFLVITGVRISVHKLILTDITGAQMELDGYNMKLKLHALAEYLPDCGLMLDLTQTLSTEVLLADQERLSVAVMLKYSLWITIEFDLICGEKVTSGSKTYGNSVFNLLSGSQDLVFTKEDSLWIDIDIGGLNPTTPFQTPTVEFVHNINHWRHGFRDTFDGDEIDMNRYKPFGADVVLSKANGGLTVIMPRAGDGITFDLGNAVGSKCQAFDFRVEAMDPGGSIRLDFDGNPQVTAVIGDTDMRSNNSVSLLTGGITIKFQIFIDGVFIATVTVCIDDFDCEIIVDCFFEYHVTLVCGGQVMESFWYHEECEEGAVTTWTATVDPTITFETVLSSDEHLGTFDFDLTGCCWACVNNQLVCSTQFFGNCNDHFSQGSDCGSPECGILSCPKGCCFESQTGICTDQGQEMCDGLFIAGNICENEDSCVHPLQATCIGGSVFNDDGGNGGFDIGEVGFEGIVVILSSEDGNVVDRVSTDQTGSFLFCFLEPGHYVVTVEFPMAGFTPTTSTEHLVWLSIAEWYSNASFGFRDAFFCGNERFCDMDRNCVFDGIPNLPLGNALLSIDNDCNLVVSNIGSSGQDGVTQDPLPPDSAQMTTTLACPNFLESVPGVKMQVDMRGVVNGHPGTVISRMMAENVGATKEIPGGDNILITGDFSFVGEDTYTVEGLITNSKSGEREIVGIFPSLKDVEILIYINDITEMTCMLHPDGSIWITVWLTRKSITIINHQIELTTDCIRIGSIHKFPDVFPDPPVMTAIDTIVTAPSGVRVPPGMAIVITSEYSGPIVDTNCCCFTKVDHNDPPPRRYLCENKAKANCAAPMIFLAGRTCSAAHACTIKDSDGIDQVTECFESDDTCTPVTTDDCVGCSSLSCKGLNIDPHFTGGSDEVCGESDSSNLGGCSGLVPFDVAVDFCQAGNMRMCTREEMDNDETANTGCGYDNDRLWTSTPCEEPGYYWTTYGESIHSERIPPECRPEIDNLNVRCCADVDPGSLVCCPPPEEFSHQCLYPALVFGHGKCLTCGLYKNDICRGDCPTWQVDDCPFMFPSAWRASCPDPMPMQDGYCWFLSGPIASGCTEEQWTVPLEPVYTEPRNHGFDDTRILATIGESSARNAPLGCCKQLGECLSPVPEDYCEQLNEYTGENWRWSISCSCEIVTDPAGTQNESACSFSEDGDAISGTTPLLSRCIGQATNCEAGFERVPGTCECCPGQDDCECSAKSCAELFLDPSTYGTPDVCADSDPRPNSTCSGEIHFEEAKEFCRVAEMRLCTLQELEGDEARDTGCGYDRRRLWSSSSCGTDSYWTAAGESTFSGSIPTECLETNDLAFTRCCADTNLATCCQEIPDREPTGLLWSVTGNFSGGFEYDGGVVTEMRIQANPSRGQSVYYFTQIPGSGRSICESHTVWDIEFYNGGILIDVGVLTMEDVIKVPLQEGAVVPGTSMGYVSESAVFNGIQINAVLAHSWSSDTWHGNTHHLVFNDIWVGSAELDTTFGVAVIQFDHADVSGPRGQTTDFSAEWGSTDDCCSSTNTVNCGQDRRCCIAGQWNCDFFDPTVGQKFCEHWEVMVTEGPFC